MYKRSFFSPLRWLRNLLIKASMTYALLCSFFAGLVCAIICVDVSPFSFQKNTQTGIRIVLFDTDLQAFQEIHYFFHTPKTPPEKIVFSLPQFCILSDGTVQLQQKIPESTYAIRTFNIIQSQESRATNKAYGFPEQTSELPTFLETLSYRPDLPQKNVKIMLWKAQGASQATFTSLHENPQSNTRERGVLGELATELTFLAHGFKKIATHNTQNQGFDGVFLSNDRKILFLTESKCRQEHKRAARYLQEAFSEQVIVQRLKKIPSVENLQFLEKLIQSHRAYVVKLVQRVRHNGQVESAWEPLNYLNYYLALEADLKKMTSRLRLLLLKEFLKHLYLGQRPRIVLWGNK